MNIAFFIKSDHVNIYAHTMIMIDMTENQQKIGNRFHKTNSLIINSLKPIT